jgi:flavin-dependent thymidylate synthase
VMKVVLAGYNVDAGVLEAARKAGVPGDHLTPEVLSAAYARISRDPKDVSDLRRVALEEVERARKSNRTIIFQMGHHSVAEHAVFNFDVVGISRLAIEWLERFRLASYTEKSQRYITLDHDFVLPEEIRGTPFEPKLLGLVEEQAAAYEKLYQTLRDELSRSHPELEARKKDRGLLDGRAKEDARYVTLLATSGQLGLTVNARNLELMVRRFAAAPLDEVRALGRVLFDTAAAAAPSLLLFTAPSAYDAETGKELAALASRLSTGSRPEEAHAGDDVRLVGMTPDADRIVAAALLHAHSDRSYQTCRDIATQLGDDGLKAVFEAALRRMAFFDAAPREFEHAVLCFEIVLSAAAYGQLKRHRMSTQSIQAYTPHLGLTVPPAIQEAGCSSELTAFAKKAEALYHELTQAGSVAAPYALTNAHRRRVLLTLNLRELYHLVRLREDGHAQWDIRGLARKMRLLAEEAMPLGSLLLSGKDGFADRLERVFGAPPAERPPS